MEEDTTNMVCIYKDVSIEWIARTIHEVVPDDFHDHSYDEDVLSGTSLISCDSNDLQ